MEIQADNVSVEQTTAENSPSSEVAQPQSTDDSREPTGSTEDSQPLSSDGSDNLDETVDAALGEVKSEKGKNRVHELAQRARQTAQATSQTRLERAGEYVQNVYNQAIQSGQDPLAAQVQLMRDEMLLDKEDRRVQAEIKAFNDLADRFPEIKDDPVLDDTIYARYSAMKDLGMNVNLDSIAQETIAWRNRIAEDAYTKAERGIGLKETTTEKAPRTTEVYTDNPMAEVQKLKQRWMQTKNQDDYQSYLSAKNRARQ